MQVNKISLSAWTASFRYPNLISGYQPTLLVPPISTILGLLNAAAGRYLEHQDLKFAYRFEYTSKEIDLEKIYMMEGDKKGSTNNRAKSNVLQREFLTDVKLNLYFDNEEMISYFKQPFYSLLIGRSGDLASVEELTSVILTKPNETDFLGGQVIPFGSSSAVPGVIQPLPINFSNELPRKNLGTRPFVLVDYQIPIQGRGINKFTDNLYSEEGQLLYFHRIKNNELVL